MAGATETEGLGVACGAAVVTDGAGVGVGVVSNALPWGGGFRPHHE